MGTARDAIQKSFGIAKKSSSLVLVLFVFNFIFSIIITLTPETPLIGSGWSFSFMSGVLGFIFGSIKPGGYAPSLLLLVLGVVCFF